jgi:amidase
VKLREMGHQVDEMKHPLDGLDFYDNFRHAFIPKYTPLLEAVTNITGKTPLKSGLIEPWTASMIELSRNYSQAQIESGNQYFKNELKSIYEPIFDKYDIILTPTMPVETPLANFITTDEDFAKRGIDLEMLLSLTSPVNPMGDCAMSVPLKFSEKTKLPVGSMFHAKSGNDKMLFELAYELEEAFPWNDKWAPHSLMFT